MTSLLAQLQQENDHLRSQLNTCQKSHQALQEQVAELEEYKHILEARDSPKETLRERILEATAAAANALLTLENFDEAVNTALQIIGESLDTDRVAVLENFDNLSEQAYGYWQVVYEWDSAYAVSQFAHSEVSRISYEGLKDLYQLFSQGYVNGGLIDDDEIFESLRVALKEVGAKSTYSVPIFVDGRFWGLVGFDDCREAKRRSPSELVVLKIAADCIGSAIHRDRNHRAREEAAFQRARELEEYNRVLEGRDCILEATASATNALLTIENYDSAVNTALQIIGESLDTDRVVVLEHFDDLSGQSLGYLQALYEWVSPYAVSQISHSELTQVSYEGIEEWYHLHLEGQWTGGVIDETPEPFRTEQKKTRVAKLAR